MTTFQFFHPADEPLLPDDDLDAILASIPGLELDGAPGDRYRGGRWSDAATGASLALDRGEPPLEEDRLHPPRAYQGWSPSGLVLHLPLAGPHWHCVEALAVAEAVLAACPSWRALDEEDAVEQEGGEAGPFPWNRPRVIASWERQRDAWAEGRPGLARMSRPLSIRLWRWRRERAEGQRRHPDAVWPEGLVLLDRATGDALPALVWADPGRDLALPPFPLLVHPGPAPALLAAGALHALTETDLGLAGARRLPAGSIDRCGTPLLPERFGALADHDWRD